MVRLYSASRTLAFLLLPLALLLPLLLPTPCRAQNSLYLQSGDNVTVSTSGTKGIYQGQPINNIINTYDQGVSVVTGSVFTLKKGGTVLDPGFVGCALYINGGTVTINGGAISSSVNQDVAIVDNGANSLTINGGTISCSGQSGAALTIGNGFIPYDPVTITGGTITVTGASGSIAILAFSAAPVTITGGNISCTGQASSTGTGLYCGGIIEMFGKSFTDGNGNPIGPYLTTGAGGVIKGKLNNGNSLNTTYFVWGGDIELIGNPLPKLALTKATTVDAQSVTVDYTISQVNVTPSLKFDFYRSHQKTMDSSSMPIGTPKTLMPNDVDDNGNKALDIGDHVVTFISGTRLPPMPSSVAEKGQQYVVVVANSDGAVSEDPASVNTIYFQKHLLGVVTHGYDPKAKSPYFWGTPSWMNAMKSDLIKLAGFDDVIEFNWEKYCTVAAPSEATDSGDRLSILVIDEADKLAKTHAGDTVDIHLIGHSRGTVVVSRTLQDLTGGVVPGSYIEVTLLDPHPANNYMGKKTFESDNGSAAAITLWDSYTDFQAAAQDPEIVLPANTGIMEVDAFYQQTPASDFGIAFEAVMNLWGEGENDGTITNNTGVSILWHPLTGADDAGVGMIGHTEVHEYYRLYFVDNGLVH